MKYVSDFIAFNQAFVSSNFPGGIYEMTGKDLYYFINLEP